MTQHLEKGVVTRGVWPMFDIENLGHYFWGILKSALGFAHLADGLSVVARTIVAIKQLFLNTVQQTSVYRLLMFENILALLARVQLFPYPNFVTTDETRGDVPGYLDDMQSKLRVSSSCVANSPELGSQGFTASHECSCDSIQGNLLNASTPDPECPLHRSLNGFSWILGDSSTRCSSPVSDTPDQTEYITPRRKLASAYRLAPDSASKLAPRYLSHDAPINRKMLILGSNYHPEGPQTLTTSTELVLDGAENDAEAYKSILRRRGYSVHKLINNTFDRFEALKTVSHFLQPARPGDLRIVVYTGHALINPDRPDQAFLLPPHCLDNTSMISAELWEKTVRENVAPGVVVLSIFATCHAGSFMPQLRDLSHLSSELSFTEPTDRSLKEPIFITFSSSLAYEYSYESSVDNLTRDQVSDHFLRALTLTASTPSVKDWSAFIRVLEKNFRRIREFGFSFDSYEMESNLQTPTLTASKLPPFSTMFPYWITWGTL